MKNTAVIFDMDGVISDTQRLHTASELIVLQELGLIYEHRSFAKRFAGISGDKIFEQIFAENKMNVSVSEAVDKKNKILYGKINEIEAMPGLIDLLKKLKEAGVKIGLASGSSKKYINTVLEKLDIKGFFQANVSAEEVSLGKPAPDVFLRAAELLNVDPRKCLVIEDGQAGMKGAKTAKMRVIALVEDVNDSWPADLVISSLTELNLSTLINWNIPVKFNKKVLGLFLFIDFLTLMVILVVLWKTGVIKI